MDTFRVFEYLKHVYREYLADLKLEPFTADACDLDRFRDWYINDFTANDEVTAFWIAEEFDFDLEFAEQLHNLFDNPMMSILVTTNWPCLALATRPAVRAAVQFVQFVMLIGYEDGRVTAVPSMMHASLRGNNGPIQDLDVGLQILQQGNLWMHKLLEYGLDGLAPEDIPENRFFTPDMIKDLRQTVDTYLHRGKHPRMYCERLSRLNTFYQQLFCTDIPDIVRRRHDAYKVVIAHRGSSSAPPATGGFTR